MARKKRRFDQAPAEPIPAENAPKPRYEDQFQQTVGRTIEDAATKLEGHGRTILYGIGALVVMGILFWLFSVWSGRSSAEAQTALGKAIEISQSAVSDTPAPAGSTEKVFKTQKERAEAAIAEFQKVADKFGGSVAEKARYFIAVNRLHVDRPAAIGELESLTSTSGEVGSLSKFALAQIRADDGQLDQSAALYQELAASSDPVIAKETINFALASIYEKQDKKAEAANVLFDLVKAASEAKDAEGKSIPLSATAQNAKDKLTELAPEKAKELPTPDPSTAANPFGM